MAKPTPKNPKATLRFEAVKIDPLFEVLDAVAWLDGPTTKDIAQYADIDGRTAGKILKNARLVGLVQSPDDSAYVLSQPYLKRVPSRRSSRGRTLPERWTLACALRDWSPRLSRRRKPATSNTHTNASPS
jgi:hypothetical protein